MEWLATLYITFDSMHRESLWNIMESYEIPCKIIHMVQMLYGSECAVLDEGEESEWFRVKTGIKQKCVMSRFFLDGRLDDEKTTAGNKTGIRWNFTSKLEDLDFADDIALISLCCTRPNKDKATESICSKDRPKNKQRENSILRINSKYKNKIPIDDQELNKVDKYTYLGAHVSKQEESGGDDIVNIIRIARVSIMKLKQIWISNIYTLISKLRLLTHLLNMCCCMAKHGK